MKIISFIKKHIFIIIIMLALLAIQAIGAITLPEYISKIVDIGIQNHGIETSVPTIIRKSEMDKLMIFINDDTILENFDLVDNENEEVYILKENTDVKKLNYSFARAITLLLIVNKDESIMNVREKVATNITQEIKSMTGSNSIMETLSSLNHENLVIVNKAIDDKLVVLTEDILSQLSSNYLLKEYESFGITNTQMNYILKSVTQMLLIALVICIAYILGTYVTVKFSAELAEYIRQRIFDYVMHMEEESFDKFTITSLMNRSVYDIQIIQKTIPLLLRTLVYVPIIFIGAYLKIRKLGSGFETSLIVVALFVFFIGLITYGFILPKLKKIQKSIDKINSITRDSLNNLFIVKGSGKEKQKTKFNFSNQIIIKNNQKVLELKSFATIAMQLSVYLASVYILWQGSLRIESETLMIGSLMAIIDYLFQISFITISTLRESMDLVKGFISFKRCEEIFIDDKKSENNQLCLINTINSIEFRGVWFKYPNAKEYILKDFYMKIEKNDTVAIIGNNASGKSTILKLLLKFYKPEKGEILVNGINIENIDSYSLRKRIGVVPQSNDVFSGDLDTNIKVGNPNITKEKIEKIKQLVQLTEFNEENKKIYYRGICY